MTFSYAFFEVIHYYCLEEKTAYNCIQKYCYLWLPKWNETGMEWLPFELVDCVADFPLITLSTESRFTAVPLMTWDDDDLARFPVLPIPTFARRFSSPGRPAIHAAYTCSYVTIHSQKHKHDLGGNRHDQM